MEKDSTSVDSPEDASADAGSSDLGPIIIPPFPVMSHEQLTESYLTEVREIVKNLAAQSQSLRAELADLRRTVDGVVKMVRTPSGVLAGTVLDTVASQVDQLHHEAFRAGGGFLGDAPSESVRDQVPDPLE